MKKRIISFLLVMAMVLGMAPMVTNEAEATTTEQWLWPVEGVYGIGSNYGLRDLDGDGTLEDYHKGIDINQFGSEIGDVSGAPVLATKSGIVYGYTNSIADNSFISNSWGNYVMIDHEDGTYSLYAHLKPNGVVTSGYVKQGQVIGYIGNTGESYGAHLHFQIYTQKNNANGSTLNPMPTNSNISIKNQYKLPAGWSSTKTTYIFEVPEKFEYQEFYHCDVTFKMSTAAHAYLMPGNLNTYPGNEYVTESKLAIGTELRATGIYENVHEGHYWYETKIGDKTAYVYVPNTEHVSINYDLSISGLKVPSQINLGSGFGIYGNVQTQGSVIAQIKGYVYAGYATSGTPVIESDLVKPNATHYEIGNEINNSLIFDDIEEPGYYTYVVEALLENWHFDGSDVPIRGVSGWTILADTVTYFEVVDPNAGVCTHDYFATVTAPTCTMEGYTTYICTKCNHTYKDNYTSATGHSYGAWTTTTAATCTADGVQGSTCSGCGDARTRTIPALGHNYVGTTVDATCTQYGYIVYTCTNCGDSYESGSGYSEWSTAYPSGVEESRIESRTEYRYQTKNFTTAATSTLEGWINYGSTTQWSAWSEWSDWSDTAVTASDSVEVETREVWGYYYYLCTSCGAHMHGYGECWTWATDPTTGKGGCGARTYYDDFVEYWSTTAWDDVGFKDWHGTGQQYAYVDGQLVFKWSDGGQKTTGYRYRTRSLETVYQFYQWSGWSDWSADAVSASDTVNVETRTVYRYALGELAEHDYRATVVAPTCTEQGYTQYTCTKCGYSYKNQYQEPLGHDTYWIYEGSDATCSEDGYSIESEICYECGEVVSTEENYEPAYGHDYYTYTYIEEDVDATCTEDGYYVEVVCCQDCDIEVSRETIVEDAYGHTPDDPVIENEIDGTCTQGSSYDVVVYCWECGEEISRETIVTPGPGHTWFSDETEPTCTEQGYTTYTCAYCGYVYVSDYVPALGHDYESVVTAPTYTEQGYTTHTCTRCGDSYKDNYTGPLVPETNVKVLVGSVTGKAGDTVEVVLTLENAPALRALGVMGITYDTDALTLISGEWLVEGALLADWNGSNHTAAAAYTQNTDLNGAIFKLIFQINEDAEAGDYTIGCTVTAKEKSGAVETVVPVATISGCVSVKDYVVGDMDGNDMLDTDDAIYLLYYTLFGEDLYPIGQGCDFDGNGMVDTDDAIYLLYHTLFGDSLYPLN